MNRIEYRTACFNKWTPSEATCWSQVGKHPFLDALYREVNEEDVVMREWHPAEGSTPAREITYQYPPPAPKHMPPEVPNLLALQVIMAEALELMLKMRPHLEPAVMELTNVQNYLESAK